MSERSMSEKESLERCFDVVGCLKDMEYEDALEVLSNSRNIVLALRREKTKDCRIEPGNPEWEVVKNDSGLSNPIGHLKALLAEGATIKS